MNWLRRDYRKNAPKPLRLSDVEGGPASGSLLGHCAEITLGQAREAVFSDGGSETRVIFVRFANDEIGVYENRCPHASTPLNTTGGSCTDSGGDHLLCHTHGALFEPLSGYCTRGPCKGDYIRRIDVDIRNGAIYSR